MSRHRNIGRIVNEALDEDEYSDDQDYDNNINEDECVNDLLDAMDYTITKEQAIKALEKKNWNFDKALDWALEQKELSKKENKKESKKETKKETKTEIKKPIINQETDVDKQKSMQNQQIQQQQKINEQKKMEPEEKKIQEVKQITRNLKAYNSIYPAQKYTLSRQLHDTKNVNIVIAGHVDSGKSTITGHLLTLLEEVSKAQIHKFEKESQQAGKASFKYAWALDETADERSRGVTIDVATRKFKYNNKQITLLDAPGHRDFVPNMISGAAQADYAIIVVDSAAENFLQGFMEGGQTLEHGKVLRSLGVEEIIFAINKFELCNWDQKQFEYIKALCTEHFEKLQYNSNNMYFIPVSGFTGENLIKKSKLKELYWYKGPSLIELIDKLEIPQRGLHKPARMSIVSFHSANTGKLRGYVISGRVEGGAFIKNKKYKIMPHNIGCTVKEILVDEEKEKETFVGENPQIVLGFDNEYENHFILPGDVICSIEYPIPITNHIVAEILTLEGDLPLIKGMRVITYIGQEKQSSRISKIDQIFDKNTGEIIKKNPKCLIPGQHAVIELKIDKDVCAEILPNFNIYSRITIREKYTILAIGFILEIK